MNFRLALACLFDARHRNTMALAGLVIGVAAIVAMLMLTLTVRREAVGRFARNGPDVIGIQKTGAATSDMALKAPGMALNVVMRAPQAVPGLKEIAPYMERNAAFSVDGRSFNGTVVGVTEAFFSINAMPVAAGRRLSDLDRFQPYAVLGREQAEAIADGGAAADLVGRDLIIAGRVVTIVGILDDSRAVSLFEGDINKSVFIPATTFARLFEKTEIKRALARVDLARDLEQTGREIAGYFESHAAGLGIQITSARQVIADMNAQLRLFTIFLGATGALAFLLGGAGMTNSLLLAVADRRAEIGLRRALGATRGDIHAQLLYEAMVLCGLGGVVGVGLGAVATLGIARFAGWTAAWSPLVLAAGLVIALGIGLVAGSVPAWQAARLDPIQSMKAE